MNTTGTLTIGCNASAVYSTNDNARIVAAPLALPAHVNLNAYVAAVVKCIGRHAFTCGRIVVYEGEPKSRHEAHKLNHLKQALRLFALARGIEIVSVNEINIDTLNDVFEANRLSENWTGTIDAKTIEGFRRLAVSQRVPFGNVVLPFDRDRFKRRTAFYELVRAATEERLHWPDYGAIRGKGNGLPMWLKSFA